MRNNGSFSKNIFSVITHLCWTVTLCLSLYVLKYTAAMYALPLDLSRSDAIAQELTETVFFCMALILIAQILWTVVVKSAERE
jgi:hypothetical protein